tara:strand:+ start:788 stop:1036 length:249 start_codon:yes stop_codon:yes gene_type:complete
MRVKFYIVSIMFIIVLGLNIILNNTLDKEREKNTNLIDEYLDISEKYTECQMENSVILDEVLRLEEENQILGSYAASQAIKD